ncbi:MAG: hypothetical protein QG622_489 [Actinomycetota bacterium]|nr:hypothetical protein [Actinomycetota bacterium]
MSGGSFLAVPSSLRELEPLACLALAAHAVVVLNSADLNENGKPWITTAAGILLVLGWTGLFGARSPLAVTIRAGSILVLGFVLQALEVDNQGYFLLWFFVLVSVYPYILPPWAGRLLPFVTPVSYLLLLLIPQKSQNPAAIMMLRALTLTLIGVFVYRAASAHRHSVDRLTLSEARAQHSLTTLQTALLPPEVVSDPPRLDVAATYRGAGADDRIGGDWYDTIALPAGGLALVIGDVEGHDLIAASVMGLVRGAVRSYALEGHPPSVIMECVNTFMLSCGIDRMVTLAYVQLYPDDAIATVALAGHPGPLVVPGDGSAPFCLPCSPGPILGLGMLTGWTERTVLLPRDSTLVLYTDGLVDFPEAADNELDRVMRRAARLVDNPVSLVAEALVSAAPAYDDAAVLVARVSAARISPAQRTFPAQPISAGIARTWVSDLFDLWTSPADAVPVTDDQRDTAALLLTELVSNAVRHSDQSFRAQVELMDRRLRVEVEDTSERMPVLRQPEAAATEGRGLRLVDTLATSWGAQLEEQGKVVWFEMDLDGRGTERRPAGPVASV